MKIKKKYSTILFAIFMALAMSFTISLILTIINTGIVPLFVEKWMRSFAIGFIVALPTSLIFVPIIRRIVDKLVVS